MSEIEIISHNVTIDKGEGQDADKAFVNFKYKVDSVRASLLIQTQLPHGTLVEKGVIEFENQALLKAAEILDAAGAYGRKASQK